MVTKDNYNAISTHSTNISPKIKDQAIYSKLKLSTPQAHAERKQIQAQDHIFTEALEDLLEHRLEETIALVNPPRSEEELASLEEKVTEDVEAVGEVEKKKEKEEEEGGEEKTKEPSKAEDRKE